MADWERVTRTKLSRYAYDEPVNAIQTENANIYSSLYIGVCGKINNYEHAFRWPFENNDDDMGNVRLRRITQNDLQKKTEEIRNFDERTFREEPF